MQKLNYIVEDSTIAELLGVQNFTSKESAILELVKNAYDAFAKNILISFTTDTLTICDNGIGMDRNTILKNWMHVGKSDKGYSLLYAEGTDERVLAGSKGIGRFALARLGASVTVYSVKEDAAPVKWTTDWNESSLDDWDNPDNIPKGTKIVIQSLRDKWTERRIISLIDYLSLTCLVESMAIQVEPNYGHEVIQYYKAPKLGENCTSKISLQYDSSRKILHYEIDSDEFLADAAKYCTDYNLVHFVNEISIIDELAGTSSIDLSPMELEFYLTSLGNFWSELYFSLKSSTTKECEDFLYKHSSLPNRYDSGIVLYRNAFSISSFDGQRDWLEFGKRSRRSPAAATHKSGSWRVRENQISGKVVIDKKENKHLHDLSNRQGLEENEYYKLFVQIIVIGVSAFERYNKCSKRKSWYAVPIVKSGSVVFFKRYDACPRLSTNPEEIYTTDIAYNLQLHNEIDAESIVFCFYNSLTLAQCEFVGRYYASGVSELTPNEFRALSIPYRRIKVNDINVVKQMFSDNEPLEKIISFVNSKTLELDLDAASIERLNSIRTKLINRRK